MLITLRPGADPITTRNALDELRLAASNRTTGQSPYDTAEDRLLGYLDWATDAVQRLRYAISDADIDRLVLTRRYYALLDGAARFTGNNQARLVNGMVGLELTERAEALEAAVKSLDDHMDRWQRHDYLIVADSSFYIQNPQRLELADLHTILGIPRLENLHLLFPIVVLDELDRLKESGKHRARWRAGYTLGVLDRVLNGRNFGTLRPETSNEGSITMEVVLDSPGHVRLPIEDDEIIDRAVAIKQVASKRTQGFRLLTCDTGQHTRGRMADLNVTKVPHSAGTGDEPDWEAEEARQQGKGTGTRAKRRARQEADSAEPDQAARENEVG